MSKQELDPRTIIADALEECGVDPSGVGCEADDIIKQLSETGYVIRHRATLQATNNSLLDALEEIENLVEHPAPYGEDADRYRAIKDIIAKVTQP